MTLHPSRILPLDDEHELVVVDDVRAWVTDRKGHRVSVTWTIAEDESLKDFTARCLQQGLRVVRFISPGD